MSITQLTSFAYHFDEKTVELWLVKADITKQQITTDKVAVRSIRLLRQLPIPRKLPKTKSGWRTQLKHWELRADF
jgi:hypothetical protein